MKDGSYKRFYSEKEYHDFVKQEVVKENLLVLREKGTGKALGVSYTEDGLKTLANKTGRYIYFKNVNNIKDIPKGIKSDKVYVEKFIPREFNNSFLNKTEAHWIECAKHKIY